MCHESDVSGRLRSHRNTDPIFLKVSENETPDYASRSTYPVCFLSPSSDGVTFIRSWKMAF